MCLATMMGLMLEEVGENIIAAILLHTRAPMYINDPGKAVFIEIIDKGNQRFIQLRLRFV